MQEAVLLVFGMVAAGIIVLVVIFALWGGRVASRKAARLQARIGDHVTVTEHRLFAWEASFLTKVPAEAIFDYFMDFERHADWDDGFRKTIHWPGGTVVVRCEGARPEGWLERVGRALSGLTDRTWTVTSCDRPVWIASEVTWGEGGGPVVERLTLASGPFGTRATLTEDNSALGPAWGSRLKKLNDPEFVREFAERSGDHQLMVARFAARTDRFRVAMETAAGAR